MKPFQLEEYLSNGVDRIVNGILKASFHDPRGSIFMIQYGGASKKARKKREMAEHQGEHIPPFLIASITEQCNLRCKGCYAQANQGCGKSPVQLTSGQWGNIFTQAEELGIGFILLAGGEPFTRRDVLEEAGRHKNILFPVFNNGTMLDEAYLKLFTSSRNLLPVLSIEGGESSTDARRGAGVYARLCQSMEMLKEAGVLYGASVTVTKENLREVTSVEFLKNLENYGCKAVIYVEYVPVDKRMIHLAPGDEERDYLDQRLRVLRQEQEELLFISFPGDEKTSGGCLAAGRGFFHINAAGGAEPCPFSPHSDTSLLHTTLREALHSPLFLRLQRDGLLLNEHVGGCVLFEQEQQVKEYLLEE